MRRKSILLTLAGAAVLGCAQAQVGQPAAPGTLEPMERSEMREELNDAREQLRDAAQVVQQMKTDPEMVRALQRAEGLFIVTAFGRAAAGIGLQGGEGVLITKRNGSWANPVFYNMGGLTLGPQIGAAGGSLAFLLMTPEAVRQFRSQDRFALSAEAGLTIAPWSAKAMAATGKLDDIYVWSGTAGLYGGANVGIQGIFPDTEANQAYYARQDATPGQILGGRVSNPREDVLAIVLAV